MSARLKDWLWIIGLSLIATGTFVLVLYFCKLLPGQVGTYRLRAIVPDVSSLGKAANVTVAGLPAGKVLSVERQGNGAVIEFALDKQYAPLPTDSRFAIRLRTLVGENYLEVYPGHSRSMLPNGAVLPPSQSIEYVEADQILNTLQGPTRARARELIRGLGAGVDGRGRQLNHLLGGAADLIRSAAPVTRVLDQDRHQVARLIDDLGVVARAVGERGAAVRELARDSRITFRAIADRDQAVRAFLDQTPPTLRQVRRTTATIQRVTPQATPVLFNLATALREAKPAVDLLAPAAKRGRAVVAEVGRAAPPLNQTLTRIRGVASPTATALPQVNRLLCQVNPVASYLRPYATDVSTFLNNLGAVTNYYDAAGHAARLQFTVGPHSAETYGPETGKLVDQLVATGLFGRQTGFGFDAYPLPGHIADLKTGRGVTGPSDVKKPYHRVHAAC